MKNMLLVLLCLVSNIAFSQYTCTNDGYGNYIVKDQNRRQIAVGKMDRVTNLVGRAPDGHVLPSYYILYYTDNLTELVDKDSRGMIIHRYAKSRDGKVYMYNMSNKQVGYYHASGTQLNFYAN